MTSKQHSPDLASPFQTDWFCSLLRPFLSFLLAFFLTLLVCPAPARSALEPFSITVDREDDVPSASACTDAPIDCSLRGAVIFANSNPGTTILLPAGTYRLIIDGTSEKGFCADATIGDLDVSGNNTSIVGSGAATTTIQQTTANDRVLCIDSNLVGSFTFSISGVHITGGRETLGVGGGGMIAGLQGDVTNVVGVTFSDNEASGTGSSVGGAIANVAGGLNIIDSGFVNNRSQGGGGALYYSTSKASDRLGLKIEDSSFRNNVTDGSGGAIKMSSSTSPSTIRTSTFDGNLSKGETSTGGAISMEGGTFSVEGSSFTANELKGTNARGGAIGLVDGASTILTVSSSRYKDNKARPENGSGIYTGYGAKTIATNNWWGCNEGPNSIGCESVADAQAHPPFPRGITSVSPWITLSARASARPLFPGDSTTIRASFLQNSSGESLSAGQVGALVLVPVSFDSVLNGSLSSGDSAIRPDGEAEATFTSGGAGLGSAQVMVDGERAAVWVSTSKASTATTLLAGERADPPVVGEAAVVNYLVRAHSGSMTPSGTVTVSDGTDSCSGMVSEGECSVILTSQGERRLVASYAGDANFEPSQSSPLPYLVEKASTSTVLAAGELEPPAAGQLATVWYTVLVDPPGTGAPGGDVIVSDGTDSCTATALDGRCSLIFTTGGTKSLIATYAGDSSFNGSTSAAKPYDVGPPATTTSITFSSPDPSAVGQLVTVQYSVAPVLNAGAPAGNVVVSDGANSCTGTVASGQCSIAFSSAGTKELAATYAGNVDFGGSTSPVESHQVDRADTVTMITSDLPDPSVVQQATIVRYEVRVNGRGSGTPTGTVTVSDGVDNCSGSVAAGQCTITPTTVGNRTLTATYGGDANFNDSTSTGTPHLVKVPNSPPTARISGGQCSTGALAGGMLELTLSDADGDPISLALASNTNTTLVPNRNIILGGTGTRRTLQITPASRRGGTSVIKLNLSDGKVTGPFVVTVMVAPDDRSTALNGTGDTDMIIGRGGNDIIRGYGGDDLLCGGAGNDTISGSDGSDIIDGGDGDDILYGDDGNDILRGGRGNDRLDGGNGDDILTQGADARPSQSRSQRGD